jgi:hypothetical protein
VDLHAPTAQDETTRGWVFSCNTSRFLSAGHWPDCMLDATVVVPKDGAAPFGLPNTDPWAWLARWDAGGTVGTADLPKPPAPARAAWFEPTLADLGPVLSVSEHQDWAAAVEAASALPVEARALIWGVILPAEPPHHALTPAGPCEAGPDARSGEVRAMSSAAGVGLLPRTTPEEHA